MRHVRGFTLAELMVVIGIMLVLMVATFGVLAIIADQSVTDKAASSVQAMLTGARDYAASNGVNAQVNFSADPNDLSGGTVMKLQYLTDSGLWVNVPGREVKLELSTIVCRKMPNTSDVTAPTNADVQAWKTYRANLLVKLTNFALTSERPPKFWSTEDIDQNHGLTNFNVVFDASGYLATDQNPGGLPKITSDPNQPSDAPYALTIIQIGGTRVVSYDFFYLNTATGTRLLFD
jgi:prepilin-type N-terminal cleavage/methylation domain-containing protein